jgi:hypothetical protein
VTQRTTPIINIKTAPKPKPVITNYERLLRVLEANAASAREPELVQRLKLALRAIERKSC